MSGIYWLASYPKSGNTWFRAFLYNYQQNGDTPADINEIATGNIASARGWLDEILGFDTADLSPDELERLRPEVYRWSKQGDEVGYHKIHDAYLYADDGTPLVSKEGTLGAVYIVRNPLDVAPSAANHWNCSLDEAITRMGKSEMTLARSRKAMASQVRQRLLTWSDHVLSWVDAPELKCLAIRYEDMLNEPQATFTRALEFLEIDVEKERVEKAIRFSDFSELSRQEAEKGFRERPANTERFFRQGKSGDWRSKLNAAQITKVVADHYEVMRRFAYLDENGEPV